MKVLLSAGSGHEFVNVHITVGAWVALLAIVVALLGIDLFRHRSNQEPTFKGALRESIGWTVVGLAFAGAIFYAYGSGAFGEFISGYLIERSLSFDNVFVWAVLFTAFGTPLRYQYRVLFWGIFGALVLRALFIGAGSALISRFWFVMVLFGLFLVYTGIKIFKDGDEDSGDAGHAKLPGMNLLRRFVPVSEEYDGAKFFTKLNGKRVATPLLAALVVIELSDVLFAVDSVPATLAVVREPFLVFASNAFAILGLRAMYFLLADARERFHYLSTALGVILIFIGIKMTVGEWVHISNTISLLVIILCLAAGVVASLKLPPKKPNAHAN